MTNEQQTPIEPLKDAQLDPIDFKNDMEKSHGHHHHSHFALEGHWQPWYSDKEDFNTNAISYYEYLAHRNEHLRLITELLNRVARRNINVLDTNSIDFVKNFDWISENDCGKYHDIIELSAHVKRSVHEEVKKYTKANFNISTTLTNELMEYVDGIWSPDYTDLFNQLINILDNEITDRKLADTALDNKINQEIQDRKDADTTLDNKINKEIQDRKDADNTINNNINNIKETINNINTIVMSANVQPPYEKIPMTPNTTYTIDRREYPPNRQFGLNYAKLEVKENNKIVKIYEWLKPEIIDWDIKPNNSENVRIGSIPISDFKAIVSENMYNQIKTYHKVYLSIDNSLSIFTVEIGVDDGNDVVYINHRKRSTGNNQYNPKFDSVVPWVVISDPTE